MKKYTPFLIVLAAIALIAATTATGTKLFTVSHKAQEYTWAVDTITDTEADTLTLGEVQASNWYGVLAVDGRQLSGTQSIIVAVQGSAWRSPDSDQWKEVARDTLNGTQEVIHIDLSRVALFSYRAILTGSGTQSTEYEAIVPLKKD